MINYKTNLFLLENEAPSTESPDSSPLRCVYCGKLAIIERDEFDVPVSALCDCEDATKELNLKNEIEKLNATLNEKYSSLEDHVNSKSYDEDTKMMRYEDRLISLKKEFNIEQ